MQKGGVGKTTLAVNISGMIAYLLSRNNESTRVLLIDLDPQASATSFFFKQNDPINYKRIFQTATNIKLSNSKDLWRFLKFTCMAQPKPHSLVFLQSAW